MIEPKVGEYFQKEGKTYKTEESEYCNDCAFSIDCALRDSKICLEMACRPTKRKDRKSVIFIEVPGFDENLRRAFGIACWLDSLPYSSRIEFYKKLNMRLKERTKLTNKK